MRSQDYLRIGIAFCALLGFYDVLYIIGLNLRPPGLSGVIQPSLAGLPLYPDFITPYAAVRAYIEGKQALIYDHAKFTAFLNGFDGHVFSFKFQPFLYPPVWLLILLPFGWLPLYPALVVFMGTTLLISAWVGRRDPWRWIIVITSPAAVWVVVSGQNTFLYVALMYAGLRLVEKAPLKAGILLGMLVYKPQICLLLPLALLADRQWRALGAMIGTAACLIVASLAVFGWDFWRAYFEMGRQLSEPQMLDIWAFRESRIHISPFIAGRILGWPDGISSAVQGGSALLGAASVWFAFRRHPPSVARTSVLMAATLLVSPYAINYDLLLLLPVAVLLFREGAMTGFYPLEPFVYPLLWLIPTAMIKFNYRLPIVPLIVVAFGAFAMLRVWRGRRSLPGAKNDAQV